MNSPIHLSSATRHRAGVSSPTATARFADTLYRRLAVATGRVPALGGLRREPRTRRPSSFGPGRRARRSFEVCPGFNGLGPGLTAGAVGLLVAALFAVLVSSALAQDPPPTTEKKPAVEAASTNAPASEVKEPNASGTNSPAANADKNAASTNQDIQVSFQGANIDMIVQWLAQTTGKSVLKHPQAQCQLTIMSSKKLPPREAIDLVYRAMSLEGVSVVESDTTIMITPEGKEPKLSPEVLDSTQKKIPEGRQRLMKLFPLAHVQAADLRDKLRGVLSDKGTIEVDESVNQLIVTDYNDNLRLIAQLINEFDVTGSGTVLQIYPLKYGDADELGNLINLIMSGQNAGAATGGRPTSGPPGRGSPMMMMGGPMPSGPQPSGDSGGSSGAGGASAAAPGIRIWPDRTANRLVVSAPKARLAEFERLLLILDTEKPADVTVRVLPLKNIQAMDLVKDIGPLYQKAGGGKTGKEAIEVAASDRSNALIILSSEANYRAIEKLVASLDTEGSQDKIVQTFALKNADAQDVAKQLQDLNRDQDNSSRYPYYVFFSGQSNDKSARKMSVVADRRRNSLIVQAPPAQMDSIAKMIEELDAPVNDDSLAPRIYHLKYVSAVDIEDVLNELFLKKTQQRSYYFFDENPEPEPDRDVGRLYGKVRITSEPVLQHADHHVELEREPRGPRGCASGIGRAFGSQRKHVADPAQVRQVAGCGQQHQYPVCQERLPAVAARKRAATAAAATKQSAAAGPAELLLPEQLRPRTGSQGGGVLPLARRPAGQSPFHGWPEHHPPGQRPGRPGPRRGRSAEQLPVDLRQCPFLSPNHEAGRRAGCTHAASADRGAHCRGFERFPRQAGRALVAQWQPGLYRG